MIVVVGYRLVWNVADNTGRVDIKLADGNSLQLKIDNVMEQIAVSALLALMPEVSYDGTSLIASAP